VPLKVSFSQYKVNVFNGNSWLSWDQAAAGNSPITSIQRTVSAHNMQLFFALRIVGETTWKRLINIAVKAIYSKSNADMNSLFERGCMKKL
jgi:hypothetical protein